MPDVDTATPTNAGDAHVQAKKSASSKPLGLGGWISAAWLMLLVVVAIVAPMLKAAPLETGSRSIRSCGAGSGLPIYDPLTCRDREAVRNQDAGTGSDGAVTHLTGVDKNGRDVFSQVLLGTRNTVLIATVSIVLAVFFGGAMGLLSGYFRGKTDTIVTTLFDVMVAFPPLVLALLLVLNFAGEDDSRRIPGIIMALVVVATPILGRIARVSTLAWSQREFVTASRALGAKPMRIILREVLPNVAPAMMSIAMLGIGIAVTAEASLALIGLGVPEDQVSWGSVVAAGGADFRSYSHLVFIASVPIVITVCCLNFLGDALRQKFDVRESAL